MFSGPDPYAETPPHPDGDEQYVLRWNRSAKRWERWYFNGGEPITRNWNEPPPAPYSFSVDELKRLAIFRTAVRARYFNEGPEEELTEPLGPVPSQPPHTDPPSD